MRRVPSFKSFERLIDPPQDLVWSIVAFEHPRSAKSVLYRQNLTFESLVKALRESQQRGANLVSIRGVGKPLSANAMRYIRKELSK